MKMIKKTLIFLLAFVMCVPLLAACGNKQPQENTPESPAKTEGEQTPNQPTRPAYTYDENGYEMDRVGTLNLDCDVSILGWKEVSTKFPEYDVQEKNFGKDTVSRAAFDKNKKVEKRLNVTLVFKTVNGWTGPGPNGAGYSRELLDQVAANQSAGGEANMQIIASYCWGPAELMIKGYLCDMVDMPYVDLQNPWWNQSIVRGCTVYDRVYFATGDIAPSFLGALFGIFFNKDVVKDYQDSIQDYLKTNYNAEDLYELYDQGDWTLASMMEISDLVGDDKEDTDTKKMYGFTAILTDIDGFFQGSGMVTLKAATDGSLMLSEDFGSVKAQTLLEKLISFFGRSDTFLSTSGNKFRTIWADGRSLFVLDEVYCISLWVDSEVNKFGILPMPKWDDAQTEYYTLPGFYLTLYCVARTSAKDESVGAVLECLASECYRRVTPAYYDDMVCTRYSATVKEAMMFDNLRDIAVIDPGRMFNQNLNSKTWLPFRNALRDGNSGWISIYKEFEESVQGKLTDMNKTILELET